MIHFTDITGLASSAVAIVAAAMLLPGVARIPRPYRVLLLCAVAGVALLPFGALPPAAYVRGVIGDLSVTTLVLLVLAILRPLCGWPAPESKARFALLALIALAALALYPMALGVGTFDPYRLGYGNPWFMGALLVMALVASFRQFALIALCIGLAVFAWSIGWYESGNLWDYLLDPLLAIYAVGALIRRGVQRLRRPQPGLVGSSLP